MQGPTLPKSSHLSVQVVEHRAEFGRVTVGTHPCYPTPATPTPATPTPSPHPHPRYPHPRCRSCCLSQLYVSLHTRQYATHIMYVCTQLMIMSFDGLLQSYADGVPDSFWKCDVRSLLQFLCSTAVQSAPALSNVG